MQNIYEMLMAGEASNNEEVNDEKEMEALEAEAELEEDEEDEDDLLSYEISGSIRVQKGTSTAAVLKYLRAKLDENSEIIDIVDLDVELM